MKRITTLAILISFVLIGCDYDVPITVEPTRKIENTLLGDWTGELETFDCKDRIRVRKYDDSSYVLTYNGDLYRAWHSDLDGTPFLTVQQLDSQDRKYSYFTWSLTAGDEHLTLREVNTDLIPKESPDSATVVNLLQANAGNSKLLGISNRFTRRKQ